jgi:DNA-binding transcriptional LysR family regulator
LACACSTGLALTAEGEAFHLRARDILAAIADAEAEVSQAGRKPRGKLRVNCVPAFALHQLMPSLPEFIARCPEVELDIALTDRVVDLLAENADVGVRSGSVQEPSLVTRKFAEIRRGLFAAPEYLTRRGNPSTPLELREHICITLKISASSHLWPFHDGGKVNNIDVGSRVLVDSGEAALRLALAGGGIARLADLIVADAVREGRLKPVLAACHVVGAGPSLRGVPAWSSSYAESAGISRLPCRALQ